MSTEGENLGAILRTIREVEESLDRRLVRATAVNLMIWGLVSGSIFLFYQLVTWNPAPYRAALGPALSWIWLAPIAVGYVASALVGTRLGRFGADRDARRAYRKGLVPGLLATVLAAFLIFNGRGDLVPGALVLVLGALFLLYGDRASAPGRACFAVGAVDVVAGAGLLLLQPAWMSLGAAVVMGGGLLATGAWLSTQAR